MHIETLLAANTPMLRMDTYFIHSVISHHPIDNHSSISTEQEEEKEFESPWFVSKSLEYQNIVDIKGATSNIATHELLDKIKQSYPSIFNDNREHINRHQHEDSESEAEIIVNLKYKHLSESQISKISDLFTVKAFVVTPSWNVLNFCQLCF